MSTAVKIEDQERRRDRRHRFERYIFYATGSNFFQGNLKDYSKGGLCIESGKVLSVGEIITIALPYIDEKNDKRRAQVVWRNSTCFGVEFFRKARNRYDIRPVRR